jgi:hypothetical protein
MASEPEYVLEDELNARELALANARELEADAHILALADAEADEAIAAGVKATMKMEDAGVIQIEDDEEPVNPKLRKPMAARSEAWEHFTKLLDSNGKVKERLCKYCNRPIQATTAGNGTSSMHRHLLFVVRINVLLFVLNYKLLPVSCSHFLLLYCKSVTCCELVNCDILFSFPICVLPFLCTCAISLPCCASLFFC